MDGFLGLALSRVSSEDPVRLETAPTGFGTAKLTPMGFVAFYPTYSRISAIESAINTRLIMPFSVKNARLTRDRSSGLTMACS